MRSLTNIRRMIFGVVIICFLGSLAFGAPRQYIISGFVQTSGGGGVEGVSVVGDNGAGSAVTDADGAYSVTVPNNWSGTITVSRAGWLITPPSKTYIKIRENKANENYTAYRPKISGYVKKADGTALSGVSVSASGGASTTTNASGYYEVFVPYGWTGTLSAALAGYDFTEKSYTNVTTNQVNQNFTGYQPKISGYVRKGDGTALSGATVSASGGASTTTNASGYYEVFVPYGWSGTLSASLSGYSFTAKSYTNVTIDQANQNFTGYQPFLFLLVDSFEAYRYQTHQDIRAVWKDSTTGGIVQNKAEVFLESTDANKFLSTGEQSMRFYYRNFEMSGGYPVGCTAEATLPLEVGTDWTVAGVKALVLNFCGDTANGQEATKDYVITDDQMWLELEDGSANAGIVRLPNMGDVTDGAWHEWNISLQDPCFSGVDMNDIAKVYIGFGGAKGGKTKTPGAGSYDTIGDTVWFDDISLYPPRCMPGMTGTDVLHALGDFTEDCNTDYLDLELMAEDWMTTDGDVVTENRPATLAGFVGDPNWTDGYIGGALEVNNTDGQDTIDVTDPRLAGLTNMTITGWVKRYGDQDGYCALVASREAPGGATELMCDGGKDNQASYGWNGDYWNFKTGLTIPDQTWTFIAVAVEPTQATVYMHPAGGAMSSNSNVDDHAALEQFSEQFYIGRSNPDGKRFEGLIDDIRIYDWTLTEANMEQLVHETGEPNSWPIYWYKFDDGAGLVAADSGTPTPIGVYTLNMSPANLVPKDPNDSEDPNLGSNAFDPNNMDIVNFRDYRIMAEHWLEQHPWP